MSHNGSTTVFGVIGDPVAHSFSPQIHGYFAEICGVNMAYLPFHVKDRYISDALRGAHALGIRGLNVTVPHKKLVMPHLVHINPMALKVGAVNTLLWTEEGYAGYNTDYIGIERTVLSFSDRRVTVIGAGGSAYAACIAAAKGGASCINIINRSLDNANALAYHVNTYYNIPINVFTLDKFSNSDIVIQTTTLGFGNTKDKSPVLDLSLFDDVQLVLDIIYSPWETVFMRQAKAAGVPKVLNGFTMLVYQAVSSFELWHTEERIQDEEIHIGILSKRLHVN